VSQGAYAAQGLWGSVVWAMDAQGRLPAQDFFRNLDPPDQAKTMALFRRLACRGRIESRENFKKLEDGLWEFKKHQIRFIGDFHPGQIFLVAHAVRKKKDKLAPADLAVARRVLGEHRARGGRPQGEDQ
jgi:hypothetical protein